MTSTAAGPEFSLSEGTTQEDLDPVLASRLVRAGAAELIEGDLVEEEGAPEAPPETATKPKRGKGKG